MVAYSFKPGFLPAIRSSVKRQTIRLPRKRHARAGEALQFFTGPRMNPIRIGAAICVGVRDVRLDFAERIVTLDEFEIIEGNEALNAFAVRDGFMPPVGASVWPWDYMGRWWAMTHPHQCAVFQGVLIDWGSTFEAAR